MNKVLLSACLVGYKVRYDGGCVSVSGTILDQWKADGRIITVCPEVDAGMSIPRAPAEIADGSGADVWSGNAKVVTNIGEDITAALILGARLALSLCQKHNIKIAVLTENSPSCGSTMVYDGNFNHRKIAGTGVTAALLKSHRIHVFSQNEIVRANRALEAL